VPGFANNLAGRLTINHGADTHAFSLLVGLDCRGSGSHNSTTTTAPYTTTVADGDLAAELYGEWLMAGATMRKGGRRLVL
jgi:hypothetical protein